MLLSRALSRGCLWASRPLQNPQRLAPTAFARCLTDQKSKDEKVAAGSPLLSKLRSATRHENIYTIPNALTVSRLLSAPVLGYFIMNRQYGLATTLFGISCVTDYLDGVIARKYNMQSVVGTVIDPMADKTLMTIMTVTLALQGLLPVMVAVIIVGRDVALAISAIYYRWISLPPPKTMTRYWDFSIPSAEVHPTMISKVNTALQMVLLGATTAFPLVEGETLGLALQGMQWTVAGTTIWSGLSYVYTKDAVTILNSEDKDSARK